MKQKKKSFTIILISNYLNTLFKSLDINKLTIGITIGYKKEAKKMNNYGFLVFEVPKIYEIDSLITCIESKIKKNKYQLLASYETMNCLKYEFHIKLSNKLRNKIDLVFSSIPITSNDGHLFGNQLQNQYTLFHEVGMPIYIVFQSYGSKIHGTTHSRISTLKLPEIIPMN